MTVFYVEEPCFGNSSPKVIDLIGRVIFFGEHSVVRYNLFAQTPWVVCNKQFYTNFKLHLLCSEIREQIFLTMLKKMFSAVDKLRGFKHFDAWSFSKGFKGMP